MKRAHELDEAGEAEVVQICRHISVGLANGNIYEMATIWDSYRALCESRGCKIPQRFLTRRKTFYDVVADKIGHLARYVRPVNRTKSLIMYPANTSTKLINDSISKNIETFDSDDDGDEDASEFQLNIPASNCLQELVHTALQIKNDLHDQTGHVNGWRGIDSDHVSQIIPPSLHAFLSILLGGMNMDQTKTSRKDNNNLERSVLNIAQDTVYAASKGRKLTPKHIGLGVSIHQLTRSENLVNMVNKAGHCVGYDTVRRIDTIIANEVLDNFESGAGVFIPEGIKHTDDGGEIVLSSFDNIDTIEETLDGNGTSHYTQMAVWQQQNGKVFDRDATTRKIGRAKTIDPMRSSKLHQLDGSDFRSNGKPMPGFGDINSTFLETEKDDMINRRTDLTWVLSRMTNDKNDADNDLKSKSTSNHPVPPWATFHGYTADPTPPRTVLGMFPILKAPADTDETVTTAMNRFMSVSDKLGQEHTIIFADQPLYSRMKEVVWSDPCKYKNVVCLLGHLHIIFNFLKAIGQHYESSGLEDI